MRERACWERCLAETVAAFGPVEGLVNDAAPTGTGSLFEPDADTWDDVLAVNLRGPFLRVQVATL